MQKLNSAAFMQEHLTKFSSWIVVSYLVADGSRLCNKISQAPRDRSWGDG